MVNARLVDDLAQFIRRVDGDNRLNTDGLGNRIATELHSNGYFISTADVVAFLERTNPDKRMGTGRLAELIVAEFGLDEEG